MGTRSLTHVKGDVWEDGQEAKTIVTIYRQMDGYPSGMGKDLAEFLAPITIVNGIGSQTTPIANGMGCLAALLIGHLKDGEVGGIYVYEPDSTDVGEEYVYTVSNKATRQDSALNLRVESVYDGMRVLYDGPPADFDPDAAEALLRD